MNTILNIADSIACNDAILNLIALSSDTSEETAAPDYWTQQHIHEQWLNVLFAFSPIAES